MEKCFQYVTSIVQYVFTVHSLHKSFRKPHIASQIKTVKIR